jgi:saccharopine dehydrogenase (NAD+, L-lysine-forming)
MILTLGSGKRSKIGTRALLLRLKVIVKGGKETGDLHRDIAGRMAPGTGLPASIAALMLDAGDVTVKGVVAPEGCIDPEKFLAALVQRGAKIHQTETIKSMLAL